MKTIKIRSIALLLALMTMFSLFQPVLASEPETVPGETTVQTEPVESTATVPTESGAPTESTVIPTEEPIPSDPAATLPPETTSPAEDIPAADPQDVPDGPSAEDAELLGGRSFTNLGMYQIMAKGKVYLDPYDTGKYLSSINRMYFSNPTEYAYCIQPGTPTGGSYTQNSNVNPWTRLSENQRRAMGVVLALGFPKTYHHDGFPEKPGKAQVMGDSLSQWQRSEYYAATQIIIWEILRGERSATPPYKRTSSATFDKFYGFNSPDWYGLLAEYTALDKLLSNYGVVPSFASSSQSNVPTHEMQFDEGSKTYKLTLTDSRNVLTLLTPASNTPQEMRHFQFQASGITIRRSGSTLTITAPESMGDQLASGILVKSNGSTADPSSNCIVWSSGSKQVLISSAGGSAEFPPAYFKLWAKPVQKTGVLKIHKTDARNGLDLSGAIFQAASSDGTVYKIGPTNAQGMAVSGDLPLGTYTVRENKAPDGYRKTEQTWSVTLTEAHSSESLAYQLEVQNEPETGTIRIVKTTSDGKNLAGWQMQVTAPDGSQQTYTTDDTGEILTGAYPIGSYTVKELSHIDPEINSKYQCTSQNPQTVQVTANQTAEVSFNNDFIPGWVDIVKQTNTGNDLGGWEIGIYTDPECSTPVSGSPFITDETGHLNPLPELMPGTYYAKELGPVSEWWELDPEVKSFQIVSQQTASVTFRNDHFGKIDIVKQMETEGPLNGWKFKVTDSEGAEIEGSPFVTDETGHFITGNLYPGTYTVEELLTEDDYYFCTGENPQTVTVTEGQTASVTFTNALKPGKLAIYKIDPYGNYLSGAKFLLEWSTDGIGWQPVTAADQVKTGGCMSPNLDQGCLTSDETGLVVFKGLHPALYYRLTEVEAPDGFVLLSDPAFEGQLKSDDFTVAITVHNSPGFSFPTTGSFGMQQCLLAGMFLILLTLGTALHSVLLVPMKNRKKKE